MKKLLFFVTALVCSWIFIYAAGAAATAPINVNADGVAIKGYDPVAYFTLGRPAKGKQEFQFEWQGAKWLFSSQEHLAGFVQNPERYAPQYGGY